MNCTLCRTTDIELNENVVQDYMTVAEGAYGTVSMVAVKPVQPDEEELHTSFEEAISDRLLAIHSRIDRISRTLPVAGDLHYDSDPVLDTVVKNTTTPLALECTDCTHSTGQLMPSLKQSQFMLHTWQRIVLFTCFALMFMLLGFDLMGFLLLHAH